MSAIEEKYPVGTVLRIQKRGVYDPNSGGIRVTVTGHTATRARLVADDGATYQLRADGDIHGGHGYARPENEEHLLADAHARFNRSLYRADALYRDNSILHHIPAEKITPVLDDLEASIKELRKHLETGN